MKNIIIAGYPKSGATWLARVTAELVGCPVEGFWKLPKSGEIAREGDDRMSDYRCYKAHHQKHEDEVFSRSNKIIYVVRDPRDIVVSGSNYFMLTKQFFLLFRWFPRWRKSYHRLYRDLVPERYRIARMTQAVLFGWAGDRWLRAPWKQHYESYLDSGVLFARYEDMLAAPHDECLKILRYLDQEVDDEAIKRTIENQSFQTAKDRFGRAGERTKVLHMRSGTSGQWKEKLSASQKALFVQELADDLRRFSYLD